MLILLPNTNQQEIDILPRTKDVSGTIVIKLRRDGDGTTEIITDINSSIKGNFVALSFSSTILQEDATYSLEITKSGNLWYRDKVYATDQQYEKQYVSRIKGEEGTFESTTCFDGELDEKHVIGDNTIYKPYDTVDDNTYII